MRKILCILVVSVLTCSLAYAAGPRENCGCGLGTILFENNDGLLSQTAAATTNGLLQSVRGLGALGSAVFIASLGRFKFRGKLLTAGSFAFPLCLLGFSAIRWFPASMAVLFGAGFAQMLVMNLANSSVQTATPIGLRGRVMSIYALVFFGIFPIGSLGVGWTASKIGEPGTIIIGAAAILAFALLTFAFTPRLRNLA